MPLNSVTTRTAIFSIDENEILRITMLPDVLVDEYDIYDNNLVIRNITQGRKTRRLFDARAKNWSMTAEAKRQAGIQYDPGKIIAVAMLVNSGLGSSLMNFFRRFSNTQQKYFTKEDKALDWLLAIKI